MVFCIIFRPLSGTKVARTYDGNVWPSKNLAQETQKTWPNTCDFFAKEAAARDLLDLPAPHARYTTYLATVTGIILVYYIALATVTGISSSSYVALATYLCMLFI